MRVQYGQHIRKVDLEGNIMAAWGLAEDLRLLVEATLDREMPSSQLMTMLEGTLGIYTLRFLHMEEDYSVLRDALKEKNLPAPIEWETPYASCKNLLENLQAVLDYCKTTRLEKETFQDTLSNALLGIETLVHMKFERLFKVYSQLVPSFHQVRYAETQNASY
jgi:hypothetical protein